MTATLRHPNGLAPAPVSGNKGNKGGKVALAWQSAWDQLHEWQEGHALAERVAPGHDIKASSLLTHIIRMVSEGHLQVQYRETKRRQVRGGKPFEATRKVAWYRINPERKK